MAENLFPFQLSGRIWGKSGLAELAGLIAKNQPRRNDALENIRYAFWSDEMLMDAEAATVEDTARARLGLSLALAVRAERAAAGQPPPVDRSKIEYSVWVEKWMLEHAHDAEWRRDFQRQHQNQWRLWQWASRPLSDAEIIRYLTLAREGRKKNIVVEDTAPGQFQQYPDLESFAQGYAQSPMLSDRFEDHVSWEPRPVLNTWDRMILGKAWNDPPPPEPGSDEVPPGGTFDESP